MTAICGDCAAEVHWRATRGARLADLPCPECKGKNCLNAARWDCDLQKYVIRDDRSQSRGRHFTVCAACGRRRLDMKTRTVPVALRLPWMSVRLPDGRFERKRVERGAVICSWHQVSDECGPFGCLECFPDAPFDPREDAVLDRDGVER